MQEPKDTLVPMYPDARLEHQHVRGMLLYAALGNLEVKGGFPRTVKGELGPFDLDGLVSFLYAENGNPNQQRNLAFEMMKDVMKQNAWLVLRARFWLTQCADEVSSKDLEKEVPDLFSHRVDLTKGMASVGWTKAELEGIRKWGHGALLGNAEAAWKLHKAFSRKGGTDLMEWSVMDQIALLKRAPKGISREEMAVFWLLIAAENGHAEAQSELGSHWVIPDYFGTARATFWLEKASKAGSEKAKKNLELLEQTHQPQYVRDIVEAWKKTVIRQ